jgi:hypothetical protein
MLVSWNKNWHRNAYEEESSFARSDKNEKKAEMLINLIKKNLERVVVGSSG